MQAAAAGVPFVTYDVDGGREVVALGAVGQVVALGDVMGAADALARLLVRGDVIERRVDVRSWDREVIYSSYRRVVDDVVGGERSVG